MEPIDTKYVFRGFKAEGGPFVSMVTQNNAIVFKAGDLAFALVLPRYRDICSDLGADERQLKAIDLLIERVKAYQKNNPELCKVPDVDAGEEEKRVCRPNDEDKEENQI